MENWASGFRLSIANVMPLYLKLGNLAITWRLAGDQMFQGAIVAKRSGALRIGAQELEGDAACVAQLAAVAVAADLPFGIDFN